MTIDVRTMRSTPPGYFTVRWGLPEYTDWIDESMSWKETCYIGDWSFLWERRFRGPGRAGLIEKEKRAAVPLASLYVREILRTHQIRHRLGDHYFRQSRIG